MKRLNDVYSQWAMNVSLYDPNSLTISFEGNVVVVQGKHDKITDESNFLTNLFTRIETQIAWIDQIFGFHPVAFVDYLFGLPCNLSTEINRTIDFSPNDCYLPIYIILYIASIVRQLFKKTIGSAYYWASIELFVLRIVI